jgi:circadian clock protein KaiB
VTENQSPDGPIALRLYVSGSSARSVEAIRTIRAVCEEHVAGRYTLEIIDVLTEPRHSSRGGILVTPTLLRVSPPPARMVVGNLGSRATILYALGLVSTDSGTEAEDVAR